MKTYLKYKILVLFIAIFCSCEMMQAAKWTDQGKYDISWYNDLSSSFDISTAQQLAGLAYLCNNGKSFSNKRINLLANIDMKAYAWDMITNFSGTLNGHGNIISNLNYELTTTNTGVYYSSFIKTISSSGKIENVKFEDVNFSMILEFGGCYSGGIACYNYGIINNCIVTGQIVTKFKGSTDATFDNYYTGGIVANNYGTIINCLHQGNVEAVPSPYSENNSAYLGGIASNNEGKIINCINYGEIYSQVNLTQLLRFELFSKKFCP